MEALKPIKTIGASPLGRAMMIRKNKLRNSTFFRKPKKDVVGSVPNDTPGTATELNAKLDGLIKFDAFETASNIAEKDNEEGLKAIAAAAKRKREEEAEARKHRGGGIVSGWLSGWPALKGGARSFPAISGPAKMSAKLDEILLAADPRPRNRLGEFAGEQEGVADPNSMAKTYSAPVQRGLGAAATGGTLLAGGAVGAVGGAAGKDVYAGLKNLVAKIKARRK